MVVSRVLVAALLCVGVAAPVSADVTFRLKASGQMLGTEAHDTIEYRRGLKVRTDWTANGRSASSILDLSSGRMIMLWHDSKSANVFEPKDVSELFGKEDVPPVRSITPTAQSREILGWKCVVYRVQGTYSTRKLDMVPPTMVMEGTMCLAKNGPGHADFSALYQASGKNQSLPDPDLGVPLAWEVTLGFKNDRSPEVMPAGSYTYEVVFISTDPIPDSMFEIPADYTVSKR